MRDSIAKRIQRLTYELNHVYFLNDAQRKMLLNELDKLKSQLETLDKVMGEYGKDNKNN